jgi:general secretion pathway protein K
VSAKRRPRTAPDRGFALLMVLWTLLLLSFIATVFGGNVRTETHLARNLVDNAQAEALADGGVYRAVAGLNKDPRDGGLRGDGRVYVWQADGGEVRFTIRDEGGKVDINQAPSALLRELFVVEGVEPARSAELADAIVDFRDEDDDKQPNGAEAREYARAGLRYGPKNRPFVLVDELIYVLGMTPELYRRIAPFLTVSGLGEGPHVPTASPEVRQAIAAALRETGASAGTNDSGFADDAYGGDAQSSRRGFSFDGASSFRSTSGSEGFDTSLTDETDAEGGAEDRSGVGLFSVHAEARTPAGAVFARDATVNLAGSESSPVVFNAWRQGSRELFPIDEPAAAE